MPWMGSGSRREEGSNWIQKAILAALAVVVVVLALSSMEQTIQINEIREENVALRRDLVRIGENAIAPAANPIIADQSVEMAALHRALTETRGEIDMIRQNMASGDSRPSPDIDAIQRELVQTRGEIAILRESLANIDTTPVAGGDDLRRELTETRAQTSLIGAKLDKFMAALGYNNL